MTFQIPDGPYYRVLLNYNYVHTLRNHPHVSYRPRCRSYRSGLLVYWRNTGFYEEEGMSLYAIRSKTTGRFRKRILTPERVSLVIGMATVVCAYIFGYMTSENIKQWLGNEPVRFVSPIPYEK